MSSSPLTKSTADARREEEIPLPLHRRGSAVPSHRPVFVFVPGGIFARPGCHLGVSYIRAALKERQGLESAQIVLSPTASASDYVTAAVKSRPSVLGFTVYDDNFLLTRLIGEAVRAELPDVPIVFGGPTATFSARQCLELCPWADCCVAGDGEEAFAELLTHFSDHGRQEPPAEVAGLYVRSPSGVQYTGDRALVGLRGGGRGTLDELPSPYLSGILDGRNQAGILTSRGCTRHCSFCNFTALSRHRVRYHSIDRVISELQIIAGSHPAGAQEEVAFYDDAFGQDIVRAKSILRGIIDAKLGGRLRFACLARADAVDEEFMELLKLANFDYLGFGLESTDPGVLRLAHKVPGLSRAAPDDERELEYVRTVKSRVAFATRLGLTTDVSVILGLPGDTMTTARKTLDEVNAMSCTWYTHNLLSLYPGTELFETHDAYGIRIIDPDAGPPFEVEHAFPVGQVPFSDRSRTSTLSLRLGLQLANILTNPWSGGSLAAQPESGVMSILTHQDLGRHAPFVRSTLGILGAVLRLFGPGERTFRARDDSARLGVHRLYYFGSSGRATDYPSAQSVTRFESLRPYIVNFYPVIDVAPYRVFEPRTQPLPEALQEPQNLRIATLSTAADLAELTADATGPATLKAGFERLAQRCDFLLESCRWGATRCPGVRLAGLLVSHDELRACYSAPGVPLRAGPAGLDVLRRAMESATLAAERRRKCAACPVGDCCSRCPFPPRLDDESFCAASRALVRAKRVTGMGPLGYKLRFI